jgi:hypothetical protein
MILAIPNRFHPACLAPPTRPRNRARRRGRRRVGCGEGDGRAVLPLRLVVVNGVGNDRRAMILVIPNRFHLACLALPRGRAIGQDGAGGGGLVVARLVAAPSCPYVWSW